MTDNRNSKHLRETFLAEVRGYLAQTERFLDADPARAAGHQEYVQFAFGEMGRFSADNRQLQQAREILGIALKSPYAGRMNGKLFISTYNSAYIPLDTMREFLGALRSANIGVSGETVSAGWIATGMAVGLEFPRFELSLFGTDTMAFVTVDTYAFSLYNPSNSEGKACQCGGVRFKAIAGYKLAILGKTALNSQHELWKKDFDKCLDNPCT